jgi:hypothetical protein
VDEIEIDVVELETLKAALEGVARLLMAVVVVEALRRDEDLFAVEADARIAWPTCASLPYAAAVSMCR